MPKFRGSFLLGRRAVQFLCPGEGVVSRRCCDLGDDTLVAIIRKADGLDEFMLFNAICFVMPVGLIVVWVMAFTWPRREPDDRYVPYPPPVGPPDYRAR